MAKKQTSAEYTNKLLKGKHSQKIFEGKIPKNAYDILKSYVDDNIERLRATRKKILFSDGEVTTMLKVIKYRNEYVKCNGLGVVLSEISATKQCSYDRIISIYGDIEGEKRWRQSRDKKSKNNKGKRRFDKDAVFHKIITSEPIHGIVLGDDITEELNHLIDSCYGVNDRYIREFEKYVPELIYTKLLDKTTTSLIESFQKIWTARGNERLKMLYGSRWERESERIYNNFPSNIQYWIRRGFDVDCAREKVTEFQKWATSHEKPYRSYLRASYWMSRGMSEDEANEKISSIQKRDVDYFVKLYGIEGYDRYNSMIEKRINAWDMKTDKEKEIINKSKGRTTKQLIEEHGHEKATEIIASRTSRMKSASKSANDFFKELDNRLGDDGIDSFYEGKNGEWFVSCGDVLYFVDYRIGNKIIEYYGDFWHCNPKLFEGKDVHPVYGYTSEKKWAEDSKRIDALVRNGYDVKIIWEMDTKTRKTQLLNECMEFINDK